MFATMSRWGLPGLLAGLLLMGTALAQTPAVPRYDRETLPGQPPPVPGFEDAPGPAEPGARPLAPTNQGEIQGRGPIHEAFAQPAESTLKPGPLAPKAPPEPVQELPPDQKPEGDNVVWIPGYWNWDEDRADYLWVSGFWRVAPAGRKWVPGYWNQTDSGWQQVSGFWADANANEVPYVNPPPATLDRGPSQPPPDDNSSYIPGCWVVREDRYLWRPGYWGRIRSGYVYCPPRYSWTPRGCLFVSGYWDLPLEDRGVLFAPVFFPRALCERRDWCYQPAYTVGLPALLSSLWVRPGAGCYAFGDYYGARYASRGYQPWVAYGPRFRDPLYSYSRWANRGNPAWAGTLAGTYRGRLNGSLALPPRTLAAQQRLTAGSRSVSANLRVVQPLSSFRSGSLRLARVSAAQRQSEVKRTTTFNRASVERRNIETRAPARGVRPAPLSLSRVPAPLARSPGAGPSPTHSRESVLPPSGPRSPSTSALPTRPPVREAHRAGTPSRPATRTDSAPRTTSRLSPGPRSAPRVTTRSGRPTPKPATFRRATPAPTMHRSAPPRRSSPPHKAPSAGKGGGRKRK